MNQPSGPAKSDSTIIPSQNTGIDTPAIEIIWPTASTQEPGFKADRVPMNVPSRKAKASARKLSSIVAGSFWRMTSPTSSSLKIDLPKSSVTALPRNVT